MTPSGNFPIRTLIVDDEPLARDRIRHLLKDDPEIEVVGEAGDGRDAVAAVKRLRPDLVFLDVQMPGMDGFQALEILQAEIDLPVIIFVTAYNEHALRAFEFSALDYLLKPYEQERFRQSLLRAKKDRRRVFDTERNRRVLALLAQRKTGGSYLEWLSAKDGERIFLLRASEIDWIEAEGNYVKIHVGAKLHLLRETISFLETRLDPGTFIRTARSTIVNVNRIRELQAWARGDFRIVLHNGAELILSRKYRENLEALLHKPL
jgi:two-component system LytT family response regulator